MQLDPEVSQERFYGAVLGLKAAFPTKLMDNNTAWAKLNAVGVDVVLEHIANGRLFTEIAAAFGVPQMAFRRWVEATIPPKDLELATRCMADAFVARAVYVMSASHGSPEEQRSAKRISDILLNSAACASPDTWMAARISGNRDVTQAAVTINVMNAPSAPQHTYQSGEQPPPPTRIAPPGFVPMRLLAGSGGRETHTVGGFELPETEASRARK